MKKIVLFSLMACLGFVNTGFAGGFWDITWRNSSFWCKGLIGVAGYDCIYYKDTSHILMCDPDKGDVGDHVFAIFQGSGRRLQDFDAYECSLSVNDQWLDRSGRFLWCGDNEKCQSVYNFADGFTFCAKARTRSLMNGLLLVDGGKKTENNQSVIKDYVGCLRCQEGYTKNKATGECEKDCPNCNEPEPTPTPTPTPTPAKKTCKELYNNYPERIKCCEAGKATYWEPKNDLVNGKCYCYDKTTTWNGKKCVSEAGGDCSQYKQGTEARACCEHEKATWDDTNKKCLCDEAYSGAKLRARWSWGKDSYGKWRGQCIPNVHILARHCCDDVNGTWIPDDDWLNGRCDCGSGKTFRYRAADNNAVPPVPRVCECVAGGNEEPAVTPIPTPCTDANCELELSLTVLCNNNSNHLISTEKYKVCKEDLDARNLNCDGLKEKVNACTDANCIKAWLTRLEEFDKLIARVCNQSVTPSPVIVPDNSAKIKAAEQTLSSFFISAERDASVWRDAEGNFNTARLASDLTAGVVLGTVGGVVSGVVIKKKQIEKGFDALHCAVGGQTVADWGDIFNVGLR